MKRNSHNLSAINATLHPPCCLHLACCVRPSWLCAGGPVSQFGRLFVRYIFHPWCAPCAQEILGDAGVKKLLFVPVCSSPTSERKSGAWRAAQLLSVAVVARGSFWCLLTDSSSSRLLPVMFDRALINPTPLLTLCRVARMWELSVMTSLTTSGCVSHVCSPGWCWGDVRNSDRLNRAFTAAWGYMKLFIFYFSLFFPGPLSWWMDWILHVL